MIKIITALILLVSVTIASQEQWYKDSQAAFQNGDYKKASELLTKVIQNNPKNDRALFDRGMCYLYLGKYQEALRDLNECTSLKPSNPDAHNAKGLVQGYLGEIEPSIESFTRAISFDNNFAQAFLNRASAYIAMQNYKNALKDLNNAQNLSPDNPSIYLNKARIYYKQDKVQDAISYFTKAIEMGMKNTDVYYQRGNAYFKIEDFTNAIKDYSTSLSFDPQNTEAINNRALAYDRTGNLKLAKADRKLLSNLSGGKYKPIDEIKFKTIKTKNGEVSIKIPSYWHYITDVNRDEIKLVATPEKIENTSSPYSIGITLSYNKDMDENFGVSNPAELEDFWRASAIKNSENYSRYEYLMTQNRKEGVYNVVVNQTRLQFTPEFPIYQLYELVYTKENTLFYGYFQCPEREFLYYQQIFDESIESLKLK